MNKNSKNFLLFAFGNFDNQSIVSYVTDSISNIVSSDFLKFKTSSDSIVIHFEYSGDRDNLNRYVNCVLEKVSVYHFLLDYNDNLLLKMGSGDYLDFMALNCSDEKNNREKIEFYKKKFQSDLDNNDSMKNSINEMNNNIDKLNEDMIELENFLNSIEELEECEDSEDDFLLKKSQKNNLDLNIILDKINESGVSSLNEEELNYLKNIK